MIVAAARQPVLQSDQIRGQQVETGTWFVRSSHAARDPGFGMVGAIAGIPRERSNLIRVQSHGLPPFNQERLDPSRALRKFGLESPRIHSLRFAPKRAIVRAVPSPVDPNQVGQSPAVQVRAAVRVGEDLQRNDEITMFVGDHPPIAGPGRGDRS
jgi:hypothetical protein